MTFLKNVTLLCRMSRFVFLCHDMSYIYVKRTSSTYLLALLKRWLYLHIHMVVSIIHHKTSSSLHLSKYPFLTYISCRIYREANKGLCVKIRCSDNICTMELPFVQIFVKSKNQYTSGSDVLLKTR